MTKPKFSKKQIEDMKKQKISQSSDGKIVKKDDRNTKPKR